MMRLCRVAPLLAVWLVDCHAPEDLGCLGSADPRCIPPSPCSGLAYTCTAGPARIRRIARLGDRPKGPRALGSAGDFLLENDRLVAVIDDVDHAHHLSPSGGTLLDLAPRGGEDHLNQVSTVTGILPRDAVRYTRLEPLELGDGTVALVGRGHLDGDPRIAVSTRWELRPCDPGVRIRTEVWNGGQDVWAHYLADVFFWGDRGATPFLPLHGQGHHQPALDLEALDDSWRTFPWVAASVHVPGASSYAMVACTRDHLEGVHDSTLSAAGLARTVLRPGDGQAFERMIFVAEGAGLSGAQSLAVEARSKLFGEPSVVVSGRTTSGAGPIGGDERLISLLVSAVDRLDAPDEAALPLSEIVPDATGAFSVRLPVGRARIQPFQLGAALGAPFLVDATRDLSLPDTLVARPPRVVATVTDPKGAPMVAELVLVPDDDKAPGGSLYGQFGVCRPYLGPPHGGSPACNRVLVRSGAVTFAAPRGRYTLYATAGPDHTLARTALDLSAGDATVSLVLSPLSVFPADARSGDFHVHGGHSFDSGGMPDVDRVLSFATAGVEVVVSTEHDVVWDYREALGALALGDRLVVVAGAETTPLVPFLYPPGIDGPTVVGHFNFWPLAFDPLSPRNGLPPDEYVEPGALFDRLRPRIGVEGVAQLNHPLSRAKNFRDEGYLEMLGYGPSKRLPDHDDGTALGSLWARPAGGARNCDWDVQEVMNGSDLLLNLAFRAQWHAFLSQGIVRAGTANSDSHSLSIERLGYPRTFVLKQPKLADFDLTRFDAAVKSGAMVGTNGPWIDATIVDGETHGPSLTPFAVGAKATLRVQVRAAPWIPVEEVRILVRGKVVHVVRTTAARPADPFGTTGVDRLSFELPLTSLLGGVDGWILVEAGMKLPETVVDAAGLPSSFVAFTGDLPGARPGEPRHEIDVVAPHTFPFAFTNPFLVDVDGGGYHPPSWTP